MIRILIFLLMVLFIAATVTYLASIESRIEAEAFGLKYSLHTGFIIGLILFLVSSLVYFTSLTKDIIALPGKIRTRQREARQERGMAALARGMESVLVGDASDAQHHARIARRNLEQTSMTRLLTAQAAQMAGDDMTARENFTLMLEAPETEFLGLHGLYHQAIGRDDKETARQYAERAFQLRPNAQWAFESVLDLCLDRGAWGETRDVLKTAKSHRLVDDSTARRGDAALLTADAYAAGFSGDHETALVEAQEALKLSPALTPAAILAASALADKGKRSRAAKVLEQAFTQSPHPAISKLYEKIHEGETRTRQAIAMRKLAGLNPDSYEGKYVSARADVLQEDWDSAIDQLQPLVTAQPYARELMALAHVVGHQHGDEAARPLIERAANAPRNPEPGADGSFNFNRSGWARLVREYMYFERLAPPPLEDQPQYLSREEVKLLAAPVLKPEEVLPTANDETSEETDIVETDPHSEDVPIVSNDSSDDSDMGKADPAPEDKTNSQDTDDKMKSTD